MNLTNRTSIAYQPDSTTMSTKPGNSIVFEPFLKEMARNRFENFRVVVAVSGGPDSTFLLRLLHHITSQRTNQLHAIHINHQLRGSESNSDQQFVSSLCAQLDIPLQIHEAKINQQSSQKGNSLEGNLRVARYAEFVKTAQEVGARYVLTGHNRDDQVETVLFRLLRGTGLQGLRGIPRIRKLSESVSVVRPLLAFPKTTILTALHELGQDFRVDKSNETNQFARNRIRNSTLPFLRQEPGQNIDQTLIRLSMEAENYYSYLDVKAAELAKHCFNVSDGLVEINSQQATAFDTPIVEHAIRQAWSDAGFPKRDMNSIKWKQVFSCIQGSIDSSMFPGSICASRDGKNVVFRQITSNG